MLNDRKIKKINEYFSRKREVDKKQLATVREQKVSVAFSTDLKISESAKISLLKKSQKSNIPFSVIKEVYRRGVLSWDNDSKKTSQQIGFERVNAFISKGQTFYNEDKDLALKVCLIEKRNSNV
jgi:hypothetical protein